MLKQGDLIVADEGGARESWWVMDRDETASDRGNTYINATCVTKPPLWFRE